MMSPFRGFRFWIVLLTFASTCFSFISSECISCPCGFNGQNYTQCFHDAPDDLHTCERWANCQTCTTNTTLCSSCPPDRFGPACSEVCGQIPHRTSQRPSRYRAGEYPWSMAIAVRRSESENIFCAGVILDRNTVLTAAQCVTGTQDLVLLFGTVHPLVTGESGSEQKGRISQVIVHPDFDAETTANDIAVVKFEPELNFTSTIQPICLPDLDFSDKYLLAGQRGLVPGWGHNYTQYMFIPAVDYEVANVSVKPGDTCFEACQKQGLSTCSTSKTFCADYPKGVDACLYWGAPMVIHDEDLERYILAGLVTRKMDERTATSKNCRRGEIDTMLTNVSDFRSFIIQNM